MTIGIVYVAVSASFPGDCKVGFTLRSADERMAELQRQYRTRHPFTAYEAMMVKNPRRVEWWAHRRLAAYRKFGTELFECAPERAKTEVLWAIDQVIAEERQHPYLRATQPERTCRRTRLKRQSNAPVPWAAIVFALATFAVVAMRYYQPVVPDWLPGSVRDSAGLIENWGRVSE